MRASCSTANDDALADEFVDRLAVDLQDDSVPPEIQRLGRTSAPWATQITNWQRSGLSNGPDRSDQQRRETGQTDRVRLRPVP